MANPPQKPRPTPEVKFVFHPEQDATYVHFEHAADNQFDSAATRVGRRNGWWLADAALLAYWRPSEAVERFKAAGLHAQAIEAGGLDAYMAWTDAFVIVAFRGTQPDQWSDVLDDALFRQEPWEHGPGHVHRGFKAALERVWPAMNPKLEELGASRTVWFSGHSLGAALATLAAARFPNTSGVVTLGSPRVGDVTFVAEFDRRFSGRSLRYVNDSDIVTHVPPPIFLPFRYDHVGALRQITRDGEVTTLPTPGSFFPRAFRRHGPRARGRARAADRQPNPAAEISPRSHAAQLCRGHLERLRATRRLVEDGSADVPDRRLVRVRMDRRPNSRMATSRRYRARVEHVERLVEARRISGSP
jgi:triacylglycerol lipase